MTTEPDILKNVLGLIVRGTFYTILMVFLFKRRLKRNYLNKSTHSLIVLFTLFFST